jgi:DNA invertase Pin-like site-specific DNA recombinase
VSSVRQVDGFGLERQLERAKEYAEKHDLILDKRSFQDKGRSAFHGDNLLAGAGLASFFAAIEDKTVPKGSYLLIEDLDRISRRPLEEAQHIFLSIINAEIVVVTLMDGEVYQKGKMDLSKMIKAILRQQLANEESEKKSDRTVKNWKKRRATAKEEGSLMIGGGALLPWLSERDGKPYCTPENKALVNRIFKLFADGGMGCKQIANLLNAEGTPPFQRLNRDGTPHKNNRKYWNDSYIVKLINNRAVLGERTFNSDHEAAETFKHYPQVVSEELFWKAQHAKAQRSQPFARGRKGEKVTNLFTGLVRCGSCQGHVRYENKGRGRAPRFVCSNAQRNAGCEVRKGFPAAEVEAKFLTAIKRTDLSQFRLDDEQVTGLVSKILAAEARLKDAEKRRDNLLDLYGDKPSEALKSRYWASEEEVSKAAEELRLLQVEKVESTATAEGFTLGIASLNENLMDKEGRLRLQSHLRNIVEMILLYPVEKAVLLKFKGIAKAPKLGDFRSLGIVVSKEKIV